MKRLLLLPLLALPLLVLSCDEQTLTEPEPDQIATDAPLYDSPFGCSLKCTPCTSPRCNTVCNFIGKCESRCTATEDCNPGYIWHERACRCVPDPLSSQDALFNSSPGQPSPDRDGDGAFCTKPAPGLAGACRIGQPCVTPVACTDERDGICAPGFTLTSTCGFDLQRCGAAPTGPIGP